MIRGQNAGGLAGYRIPGLRMGQIKPNGETGRQTMIRIVDGEDAAKSSGGGIDDRRGIGKPAPNFAVDRCLRMKAVPVSFQQQPEQPQWQMQLRLDRVQVDKRQEIVRRCHGGARDPFDSQDFS